MKTTEHSRTLAGATGSADHERHQIRSGMWDLIYTEDGWELENQHSYTCHKRKRRPWCLLDGVV